MKITALDLYSGSGGTTEGAEQAGVNVLWAANHNLIAVETHRRNHPNVEVSCQDLKQANFCQVLKKIGRTNIVYASPECRGHTKARGSEQPHHDDSRATAYAVLSCVEVIQPDIVIIENVPEFRNWGPRCRKTGRLCDKGLNYFLWRSTLQGAGYLLSENILDSADLGVPQHRKRLFVVGVHKDVSSRPIHIPQPNKKHIPSRNIIDFSRRMDKIDSDRLCQTTLRKIHNGKVMLGDSFLIQYNGNSGARSLDEPIGSITTKERFGLVVKDRYRMLSVDEYKAAMGFRKSYLLPKKKADAVKLLGNAVVPRVAKYVTEHVLGKVYNKAA
jgi:DNA (cytosine-5)-methyltransferase 1